MTDHQAIPDRTQWNLLDFGGTSGATGFRWVNVDHVLVGDQGFIPRRICPSAGGHLIEGRSLLNSIDLLLADSVHPSDHGAAEIARNLAPQMKSITPKKVE